MKVSTLLLCGLLATCACAQEPPKNGYQTLLTAAKLMVAGENGNPATPDANFPPAENLRRERLAVARNAPALQLLREALKQSIEVPVVNTALGVNHAENDSFRKLARQLRQESDVRLADGDAAGALDSRLTALELGVSLTNGASYDGVWSAAPIEAVARQDFEIIASKLKAPQIRAALTRWTAIEARRSSYVQTLQVEKERMLS